MGYDVMNNVNCKKEKKNKKKNFFKGRNWKNYRFN